MRQLKTYAYDDLKSVWIREAEKLKARKYPPLIYEINIIKEAPDAATELITNFTTEFDGTTTPVEIGVVSSDAGDDTGAGDHVQQVTVFGVDENDAYTTDDIATNGVAIVDGTVKWKRLISAWASSWGSGGADAAGNITIVTKTTGAATYMTIAAGSNETVSARFWIASGYSARIIRAKMSLYANVAAGSDIDTKAASLLWPLFTDGTDTDPDIVNGLHCGYSDVVDVMNPFGFQEYAGGDDAKLTFYHHCTDDDANEDFAYYICLLIWPTSNANRGLPS